MSSQIPPDPITTNYNPSAWAIPELTEEEMIALDKAYVKFPIAQNQPITFPATVYGSTAATDENSLIVATTAWVNNFFTYIRTLAWTWSGYQSFTGGIQTPSIGPITVGNTLTIGNFVTGNVNIATHTSRGAILHLGDGNSASGAIHIGNGNNATNGVNILNGTGSTGIINLGSSTSTTNLNCALTPFYTYPVGSGRLGEFLTGTNDASLTLVANTPKTLSSQSLTAGIWILFGSFAYNANSVYLTIAFSTTTNSITTGLISIDTCPVAGTGPAQTHTYIVQPTATTTYYLVANTGVGGTASSVLLNAVRIA